MRQETSTSLDKIIQKVEKAESTLLQTRIEKEETNKIENNKSIEIINKIQNKDKTINIISSKVDNQLFFFMLQIKQMIQRQSDIEIIFTKLKKFNYH